MNKEHAATQVYTNATQIKGYKLLIPDADLFYFTMINTWGLGQGVTVLGLIVNVLNIATFLKQGVKDTVNVSLLGLTVSDFGSLVFHFLVNLCWTPPIMKLDLPFYPNQVMYFFVWAHILFTRVTTGTTAWIAFERCLCIVAPLKIKTIITPRRTVGFIAVLYAIMIASVAPTFYTARFTWVFDQARNKSVLGIVKIADRERIESVAFWINNLLPTLFFILIVICTTILVKALKRNAQWRQRTASATKTNQMSNRDAKVVKLVSVISIVFIFCYAPGAVVFVMLLAYPEMNYAGRQKNVLIISLSFLMHLEGINATANFFIYLKQSSKFKVTFEGLFCVRQMENNEKMTSP